jgi:two-component system KDP operon response regulator KdpE
MSDAPKPAALFIEDDPPIRRFVRMALESEGWQVCEADTVERGLIEAATRKPELVVLDLGLPDRDGVEFIREFRAWSAVPIVILSARTEESRKIEALDAGADDYLTKPFGIGEFLARVRVARRRWAQRGGSPSPVVRFGDIVVDLARRRVEREGRPVHLTPIEYRLFALLIASAGRVLTHRQILKEVWGPAAVDSSHYLRIYLRQLRQKLEADPARPRFLLTETGIGYRLLLPADERPEA